MLRLFCSLQDIVEDKIVISQADTVHHVKSVLRVRPGEQAVVCDDQGSEYYCLIETLDPGRLVLKIKEKIGALEGQGMIITVACAIPKKSKFEEIIDKLTQVGVDRIIPMLTERVIVKLDQHKEALRLKRWQSVALSAAEQSQRRILPQISEVLDFSQVLDLAKKEKYDLKLIPYLCGERKSLKEVMSVTKAKKVLFLIGPEGDFTPHEASLAIAAGFIPVTLGDLVLRVETAAVVVASFIRLHENR